MAIRPLIGKTRQQLKVTPVDFLCAARICALTNIVRKTLRCLSYSVTFTGVPTGAFS
jgi:hypothetical protein